MSRKLTEVVSKTTTLQNDGIWLRAIDTTLAMCVFHLRLLFQPCTKPFKERRCMPTTEQTLHSSSTVKSLISVCANVLFPGAVSATSPILMIVSGVAPYRQVSQCQNARVGWSVRKLCTPSVKIDMSGRPLRKLTAPSPWRNTPSVVTVSS